MRFREFERRVGRRPTKREAKEMSKRLQKLYKTVEKWFAGMPHDSPGGVEIDTKKLDPQVRAILRAHDACDWFSIEEDLAPEDGA